MLILLTVVMLLGGAGPQEPKTSRAEVTLVVEPARGGALVFRCNGKVLDQKQLESGLHAVLRAFEPSNLEMFVLQCYRRSRVLISALSRSRVDALRQFGKRHQLELAVMTVPH